jgi:hypothetical protein
MSESDNKEEKEKGVRLVHKIESKHPGIYSVAFSKAYKAAGRKKNRGPGPHSKPASAIPEEFKFTQTSSLNIAESCEDEEESVISIDNFGHLKFMINQSPLKKILNSLFVLGLLVFQAISMASVFVLVCC